MTREYIEKILHQDVQILPYTETEKLPLSYRSGYDVKLMAIGGLQALLAEPVEKTPLAALRKQHHQMMVYTGLPCVLYLTDMNYYTRDAMLDEGIPFVWENHQIYLPFIGILLDDHQRQMVISCPKISYLTQRLLLTALYQGWQKVTVTKAAKILGVSKMSVTRCFDELEVFNVPYLTVRNRARSITVDNDRKEMWKNLQNILRNPVITSYDLRELPDRPFPLSGLAALAQYSMLDDEPVPIYAITKKDLSDIRISNNMLVPAGEEPKCILQELGYQIPYGNGRVVDPLTVALSINEDEKSDPRVSMAIDEMLEENVWLKE